jgi:hypothetical protein
MLAIQGSKFLIIILSKWHVIRITLKKKKKKVAYIS